MERGEHNLRKRAVGQRRRREAKTQDKDPVRRTTVIGKRRGKGQMAPNEKGKEPRSRSTAYESSEPRGGVDDVTLKDTIQESRGPRQVQLPCEGLSNGWCTGVQVRHVVR
ncbi:hypothetical protein NDU88_005410 [Pleurodeles waltl]|uniref:Uncharacterized protein n=1 Tax=Pleurodeles waltl TaxID=8319 RepID=A0AAV7WZF8_PLEWA|nr:hypothetical protein NDU88_005410 [Pleurodeles waltl]